MSDGVLVVSKSSDYGGGYSDGVVADNRVMMR